MSGVYTNVGLQFCLQLSVDVVKVKYEIVCNRNVSELWENGHYLTATGRKVQLSNIMNNIYIEWALLAQNM